MVKLVTARESRLYGPYRVRCRWEYINAGLYVFAAFLLLVGFSAQLPRGGLSSAALVVAIIGLVLMAAVNAHDLVAHVAGIDYRLTLLRYDLQLGLVELMAPLVQLFGSILTIIGVILLLSQEDKGHSYRLQMHAVNTLIAGPLLWVLGNILNTCQVYERADGHTQILQSTVHVPFLMGSLLFLVGGFFNRHYVLGPVRHDFKIIARSWVWLCVFGSLLFFAGGLFNVLKVFKMQQTDGLRLEKLRGGAQERLSRDREGRVPLNWEAARRTTRTGEEVIQASVPKP
ncbi:uncharacterized protein [Typha latifolia]|uniref:uncharacterized protein n=1 Tax=Typha latifolia TaxID=4733 RepID=UPI003C2B4339